MYNINIENTASNLIRIHTTGPNGQTLSVVDLSIDSVDKMIAILTNCRARIIHSRASYRTQDYSAPQHREAGPAYSGQPAGGYGGWDGCGGGGGYGAGGCGNGL
jgi:hypothetical protein